jgi:hypothetical protein
MYIYWFIKIYVVTESDAKEDFVLSFLYSFFCGVGLKPP